MGSTACPKCHFEQDGGEECLRCGLIFAKYVAPPEPEAAANPYVPSYRPAPEDAAPAIESPSGFRRFYRVFRWVALAGALLVIFLILRTAPPPEIDTDPAAGSRVTAKMQELQFAVQSGRPHTLQLNEAELNTLLRSRLALASSPGEGITTVQRKMADLATGGAITRIAPPPTAPQEPTREEVHSSVRDIKIDLLDDRVRAYLLFELYGKEMSLLIEGRLRVQDGYLRLEPTAGRLGSFPIPGPALDRAVSRLFDSLENREKFRVPNNVRDIRVEGGELRILYR